LIKKKKFAGIQYLGEAGVSLFCKQAVIKLIHSGDEIKEVKILTARKDRYSQEHCLLITDTFDIQTAIKSGFSSGYSGEGPKTFSCVLMLLQKYTNEIAEFIVPSNILEKIDNSCLTIKDMESINSSKKVLPTKWHDYTYDMGCPDIFQDFPAEIPLALIDKRLISHALNFSNNPDHEILNAYRLLESTVRNRTGLNDSSTNLFKKAFLNKDSILYWNNIDPGESTGRASLFISTYMAYRNNRAHQEPKNSFKDDLREFMVINHLFILESESVLREKT